MNALPRGKLIHFRCLFDGKVRCEWKAVSHGNGFAHTLNKRKGNKRKRDPWKLGPAEPSDAVRSIKHGYSVTRNLDTP